MDKIYKIINLEQAKNRTPNPIQHYVIDYEEHTCNLQDYETFGGYCLDILIPKTADVCVPLISWAYDLDNVYHFEEVQVETFSILDGNVIRSNCEFGECDIDDITVAYWIRYKNLMAMYHWLLNVFIPSINFYQKCTNGYRQIRVSDRKDIFKTDIEIFSELPTNDELEPGTIIGITPLYNEFISKFVSVETCKSFLLFMEKLLNDGIFSPISGTTPYIDIELSITSDGIDTGLMSPLCQEWIPNKKYYLGDVVLYNSETYILTQCSYAKFDKIELTGELLNSIQETLRNIPDYYNVVTSEDNIPSETFEMNLGSAASNVIEYKPCLLKETKGEITTWYLVAPYDNGDYDNNSKATTFYSYYWTKWVVNQKVTDSLAYTGITESKLISLKRKITSVDDFGEILPFIIKDDDPNNIHGEIPYMTGITNERVYEDGTFRGDELCGVFISPINTDDLSSWTDISGDSITSDKFNDNGFIKFIYCIGCELDDNKNVIQYTGVRYEEIWKYNKQQMTARIEHTDYTFDYIVVTPIDNNETVNNLDIVDKNPILSEITYYGNEINELNYLLSPYIKQDELLGIQDVNTTEYDMHSGKFVSTINGYIERGTAGALERHQILGEVKTFSDLENYRNNFFQI